ncbi:MAG: non-homologous end-joining DNA ligase [Acidimicrobiales bacterium]
MSSARPSCGNDRGVPARLSTYRAKRDATRTSEPMGRSRPGARARSRPAAFVIQEHHARSLHWDFRLERGGVLVSWALPKGLPKSPSANHLAVHTEDHPIEYADFEGEIPEGEYGAGRVEIWDSGTYELEKWTEREVIVTLAGERAKGRYVLFATKDKNWMIHRMAQLEDGFEEMPEHVRPMLALSGTLPVRGGPWAYEFKWDGVRAIVFVDGGRARATTRNDKDLSVSFPELRELGEFLGSSSAVLDGEIVAFDDDSRPSFARLQRRLHLASPSVVARRAREVPASFLAFDLLYLDGRLLLGCPYEERRRLLESLELAGNSFGTPPSARGAKGSEMLALATQRGLEGVVAKRLGAPYALGQRNGDWIKVKNLKTQEVVIGGFTAGKGEREGSLGALLIGVPAKEGLVYAGKVGTGFNESSRSQLLDALRPLAVNESPFEGRLSRKEEAAATFVHPELVGEVQFGEWTSDGRLRHPSWRGLRPDKGLAEVAREP